MAKNQRFTQQPQGPVAIDRGNVFGARAKIVLLPSSWGNSPRELITNSGTFTGTIVRSQNNAGQSFRFSATSTLMIPGQRTLDNDRSFTILTVSKWTDANTSSVIGYRSDAGYGWTLSNSNATGGYTPYLAGAWQGTIGRLSATAHPAPSSKAGVMVASVKMSTAASSTVGESWMNGVYLGAGAGFTTDPQLFSTGANNRLYLNTAPTGNFLQHLSLVVFFEGPMTDAQAKAISANPWQIFRPIDRTVILLGGTLSGPSPISGAASVTLDAATTTATGTVAAQGTSSSTLNSATVTATGVVPVVGVSSSTLDAATLTASSTVTVAGTASVTLEAATATGSGTAPIVGTASNTLDAATLTAVGGAANLPISGTSSNTLEVATTMATGKVAVVGTESSTLEAVTLVAAGGVRIAGVASNTLDAATVTSAGRASVKAVVSATLEAATLNSTNYVPTNAPQIRSAYVGGLRRIRTAYGGLTASGGTVSATLGAATVSATGVVPVTGVVSATLGAATVSATTQGADPLATPLIRRAYLGGQKQIRSAYILTDIISPLADATLTATASLASGAVVSSTLAAATAAAVGEVYDAGIFQIAFGNIGVVSRQLAGVSSTITGVVAVYGTATRTLDAATASAVGEVRSPVLVSGLVSASLEAATCTAAGTTPALTGELIATLDPATSIGYSAADKLAQFVPMYFQSLAQFGSEYVIRSVPLGDASLSATVDVFTPLAPVTVTSTGRVPVVGLLNATLQSVSLAVTSDVLITGVLDVVLQDVNRPEPKQKISDVSLGARENYVTLDAREPAIGIACRSADIKFLELEYV